MKKRFLRYLIVALVMAVLSMPILHMDAQAKTKTTQAKTTKSTTKTTTTKTTATKTTVTKKTTKKKTIVIYTGNKKIDCAAEAIISRCTKESMTKKQKLKACYKYLVKHMTYSHSSGRVKIKPTKKEKKAFKLKLKELKSTKSIKYSKKFRGDWQNVLTMRGTCKDMSGVMCILANHLGYSAGYVTGRYVRSNGSSVEHWWNYIKVKGKKLYCDVQAANDGGHSESRMNSYYLKSGGSGNWRRHHRW